MSRCIAPYSIDAIAQQKTLASQQYTTKELPKIAEIEAPVIPVGYNGRECLRVDRGRTLLYIPKILVRALPTLKHSCS